MRWSQVYRPPVPTGEGGGGGASYVPDPGAVDDGGDQNRAQAGRNAIRNARIQSLRDNPMFRKSSTPITFKEGYDPKIMQKMIAIQSQNIRGRGGNIYMPAEKETLSSLYRPRRSYR